MKSWEEYKKEIKKREDISSDDIKEMEEMAKIVQRVTQKREKLGLSQRELANLCGIPQSTVARFETFNTSPTLDTLLKLTRKLGLKVAIL